MFIYIVCPVRQITESQKHRIEKYVAELEAQGHIVHLPFRDIVQENITGWEACLQNGMAMANAERVDICYHSGSTGSHFDIGYCLALRKPLKIAMVFTPKTPEDRTFLDVIEAVESISPFTNKEIKGE